MKHPASSSTLMGLWLSVLQCKLRSLRVEKNCPAIQVSPELEKIIEDDSAQFPLWASALLVLMTAYMVVYAVMKRSAVSTRSLAAYWLWYFSPVPALCSFTLATSWSLKGKRKGRTDAGC